jgi:hypothetical protein
VNAEGITAAGDRHGKSAQGKRQENKERDLPLVPGQLSDHELQPLSNVTLPISDNMPIRCMGAQEQSAGMAVFMDDVVQRIGVGDLIWVNNRDDCAGEPRLIKG